MPRLSSMDKIRIRRKDTELGEFIQELVLELLKTGFLQAGYCVENDSQLKVAQTRLIENYIYRRCVLSKDRSLEPESIRAILEQAAPAF